MKLRTGLWLVAAAFCLAAGSAGAADECPQKQQDDEEPCEYRDQKTGLPDCEKCCETACQWADNLVEADQYRETYADPALRRRAVEYAMENDGGGAIEHDRLVKERLNQWLDDGFESACSGGPSGSKTCQQETLEALPFLATNLVTCELNHRKEQEKRMCSAMFALYLDHEAHHAVWCGRKDTPFYTHGFDGENCSKLFRFDDENRRQCYAAAVNDFADEEVRAYDDLARDLRLGLARLRKRCGTSTTMDDHLVTLDERDKELLRGAFDLMEGWK